MLDILRHQLVFEFKRVNTVYKMKFIIVLCLFAILGFSSSEECKWRKNHIYYSISGEENVRGISTLNIRNCIARVFHIFENSLPGYYFTNIDAAVNEEIDVTVSFENLKLSDDPSFSEVNCTDGVAIRSGAVFFNTNFIFMCKHMDNADTSTYGVDLFTLGLHEVGHLIGMTNNDDPTSIVFKQSDNFDYYQKRGSLNNGDRQRVEKLYMD